MAKHNLSFLIKPAQGGLRKVIEITSDIKPALYDIWQLQPSSNVRVRCLVEAIAVHPADNKIICECTELPAKKPWGGSFKRHGSTGDDSDNDTLEMWSTGGGQ